MLPPTCNADTPYNAVDRAYPIVRCGHCAASVGGNNWDQRGKSAIEFWNTRRAPAPVAPGGVITEEDCKPIGKAMDDLYWFIPTADGDLIPVRCGIRSMTDNPLSNTEMLIGRLCERINRMSAALSPDAKVGGRE